MKVQPTKPNDDVNSVISFDRYEQQVTRKDMNSDFRVSRGYRENQIPKSFRNQNEIENLPGKPKVTNDEEIKQNNAKFYKNIRKKVNFYDFLFTYHFNYRQK